MATYTAAYFSDIKQHKYDKKVSVVEKVVNLGGDYPARKFPNGNDYETGIPYAVDDVIEVIGLRAGTTVLDVEVDLLTVAGIYDGADVEIGDGSDTDRFGVFDVQNSGSTGIIRPAIGTDREGRLGGRFQPHYYASADTIDVKIKHAYAPYQSGTNETPTNLTTTPLFGATTGWTTDQVKWNIAGGVATRTASATAPTMVEATTMTAGRYYYSSHDAATLTAGSYTINGNSTTISAAATNIRLLHRVTTSAAFTFTSSATHAGTIDNCYLYLLPQNVAKFKVRAYILEDRRKTKIY
jgi:hypothetical protein